ncbi:uncharacterized protein LOC111341501 [Stylophora pistillata]|uniref:uncharacterized protein LOC111341501 n=1 Tax=Stylophora pistillata TaxID=50429 RepID=UPI000C04CFCD|nr:uncharacterized protein LOC111341501 [Stylophora pistillata]
MRRYFDDTLVIMPGPDVAESFLDVLNGLHPSIDFNMELSNNDSIPFIGMFITKNGNKELSSTHQAFIDECKHLQSMFAHLGYPSSLVNGIIDECEYSPTREAKTKPVTDKNECENPDVCGKGPKCVNTLGSYQCKCVGDKEVGYEYVADMKQCMDVNECAQQLCDKNSTICKNSIGSYKCGCKPGYSNMKKNKCKDEDECKTRKHNCEKQSYCRNTPGSFKCECPKGFEKDGHKCRATRLTRWLTPKYLLRDIKQGVWDTLAVAGSACVIVLALLIIFMVKLRKCCKKCCKKPGYEDQFYYPDEMYDPDQMFFAESEPMFYPEEMAYHGEEMMYPAKGMYPEGYSEDGMYCEGYPEDEYYPEGVEDANHGLDMTDKSIFNLNVKRSENVPVTYYDNDNEDLSDEYD